MKPHPHTIVEVACPHCGQVVKAEKHEFSEGPLLVIDPKAHGCPGKMQPAAGPDTQEAT